jgi:tRNA-uridine 2-sulfurtransferase
MLARLDPAELDRVLFPLGEQTKDETRAEAHRAGLRVASRGESQEACFLAGDDYRAFLERRGAVAAEGSIVDEDGRELGRHSGHWRFTPGQRRGLGLSAAQPLYALRSDARTNTVVVGPREALGRTTVAVAGTLYLPVEHAEAKLRYRSNAVPATVEPTEDGFRLELGSPVYGVAPGQAAVLYDGDAVVGAGLIKAGA